MPMFQLVLRDKATGETVTRDVEANHAAQAGFIVGDEFKLANTELIDCIRLS